jgi:SOS-response transcriptional repressor LexA
MEENSQLVNSASDASTSDGIARPNGGPPIKKLTAQGKVDRVLEVFRMGDISAAQKVIAATFVCMADEDGITPMISAADLKDYAVVKNQKTVRSAIQKLEEKKIAKPFPNEGKARRYAVLLDEAIDAAIDEIDAPTSAKQWQDQLLEVPANDPSQQTVPLPANGTPKTVPLPANGGGPLPANGGGPLPANGGGQMQRESKDPERENAREEADATESIKVNGVAIHGPGFKIDFEAVDMASALAGVDTKRGRQIAEICARDWAANGEKPRSPMAVVKRAIASDRNHKQTDEARQTRETVSSRSKLGDKAELAKALREIEEEQQRKSTRGVRTHVD